MLLSYFPDLFKDNLKRAFQEKTEFGGFSIQSLEHLMSPAVVGHIRKCLIHSFPPLEPVSAVQPSPQIPPEAVSPVHLPPPDANPNPALRPVQTSVTAAPGMGSIPADPDDEEGLKHLEQVDPSSYSRFIIVI